MGFCTEYCEYVDELQNLVKKWTDIELEHKNKIMKINIKDNTFRRVESRIIRCLNKCESDCTSQNERDIEIEEHTLEILDIAFNDTKNGKKLLLSLLNL